ncbi:hypothetical protein I553_2116 [Mycobacterium xenopi 4042]|uniref:Uncharacterized protein n=1 Tax=Mycobacterium xenopi 4042 TaxID=1299334 RepID=X8DMJ4_MYCXE|nr:hypothetical protein I553_2116 [Mycobacterium xenopi 4042]
MGKLLFAAGADQVLTGLPAGATVNSVTALQEVLRRTNPKSLHLAAFHPTGTAAAGADAQRCPSTSGEGCAASAACGSPMRRSCRAALR